MRYLVAAAAVLSVSCASFGAVSYDATTFTLSYGAPSDLGTVIDPPGLADVQQEFGLTKAQVTALSPQVVTFDTPTGTGIGTPDKLVVTYAAGKTLAFTFAAKYNWGGYATAGRQAFSGTAGWHDISGVETQPDNCWFDVPALTVAPAVQGVKAIGFCAHGRNDGNIVNPNQTGLDDKQSGPGEAIFTLSDGSTESVPYPIFGGNGIALQRIFIGYQAPEGKTIVGFRCTRPGTGNSFIAIDDLAFVMTAPTIILVGDINGDGYVNVGDLQALVAAWGRGPGYRGPEDINGDGYVNVGDLQLLVAHWGEHL